jgi:single-strand DNA-binding protein
MNSCILMAEIVQDPQLRYTSDNQVPVAEMLVQFPGLKAEDPPATLKVVGWGNLAQEIKERYHSGDRVVLEGRLAMTRIDRPEGFKETRAELTVQRVHPLGADTNFTSPMPMATPARTAPAAPVEDYSSRSSVAAPARAKVASPPVMEDDEHIPSVRTPQYQNTPMPTSQPDVDDIPF